MRDSEAVRQSSHKLKGAAANLSLPKVAETAALIETAAKSNTLYTAGQLMPELEHRFSLARIAVHELLAPSSPSREPDDARQESQRHEHSDS
jgi:HPt (histidine-containing phosphotransfer) domain-containing protein